MASVPEPTDEAAHFAEDAEKAGIVVPGPRRFHPGIAASLLSLLVVTSVIVGYETGWMNPHRPLPDPFAGLPGCSGGGVTLDVATETEASVGLPTAWAALTSGFSSATGRCLTVDSGPSFNAWASLAGAGVDGVVGPQLPDASTSGGLAGTTFAVPLLVAPVVVLVNAEGLSPVLNLSADALAGAYLGTLTSWDEPELTEENPGLRSDLNVTVVYLAGTSETNEVFSTYLAQGNETFRSSLVPGDSVPWPVGEGATSPSEVTTLVASTAGAIGYEPGDVCPSLPHGLVCASVQAGPASFVAPTASGVAMAASLEANSTSAIAGAWANVSGVVPWGSAAYPMVQTTYAVVYRDLGTAYGPSLGLNASKWLVALLFWIASDTGDGVGQLTVSSGYLPLPGSLAIMAEETALSVTYLGQWILLPPGALQEGAGEGGGGETGEF